MTTSEITAEHAVRSPSVLWDEIVHFTVRACVLRKEGEEAEVRPILDDYLPTLIREWSRTSGLPPELCKEQLRGLFTRAQETVEMGSLTRRYIVSEICARLTAPQATVTSIAVGMRSEVLTAPSLQLRRRIPIENVTEMLDALAEAEQKTTAASALAKRAQPMRPQTISGEPAVLCA